VFDSVMQYRIAVLRYGGIEAAPGVRRVDATDELTEDLAEHRSARDGTPDLKILLEAMAAVIGEVSKVYQAVKRAVDSSDAADYRRALAAFDGLPAWQKERILRVAVARAAEVTDPAMPDAPSDPAASQL
jgi:hypothetical protein